MLYEIRNARQVPGEGFRRWFTDPDHDLIVWYPDEGSPTIDGFQFAYDKQGDEHALTWTRARGFEHHRIDSGESRTGAVGVGPAGHASTPVLVTDGLPDVKRLSHRFAEVAARVDEDIVSFVQKKLREAGA